MQYVILLGRLGKEEELVIESESVVDSVGGRMEAHIEMNGFITVTGRDMQMSTHSLTPSAVNFLSRNVLNYFCYECVA